MSLSVVPMSEASLAYKDTRETKVQPISAIYEVAISGDDLKQLRRIGAASGAQGAIEHAIRDYIATNGHAPLLESVATVQAKVDEAEERGVDYL